MLKEPGIFFQKSGVFRSPHLLRFYKFSIGQQGAWLGTIFYLLVETLHVTLPYYLQYTGDRSNRFRPSPMQQLLQSIVNVHATISHATVLGDLYSLARLFYFPANIASRELPQTNALYLHFLFLQGHLVSLRIQKKYAYFQPSLSRHTAFLLGFTSDSVHHINSHLSR